MARENGEWPAGGADSHFLLIQIGPLDCVHSLVGERTMRIIPFQSRRNREQASSRQIGLHFIHPSGSMRSQADFGPPGRSTRILKLQVARIAQLLDDLEDITRTSDTFPLAIAGQRHAGMERARGNLQSCSGSEREAGREDDIEGDPQPDIDSEMLERMYRELDPDD